MNIPNIADSLQTIKNSASQAVTWMGKHKVETAGYAIAGAAAITAIAAAIFATGGLALALGVCFGGASIISLCVTALYKHMKEEPKAEDKLDDAARQKIAHDVVGEVLADVLSTVGKDEKAKKAVAKEIAKEAAAQVRKEAPAKTLARIAAIGKLEAQMKARMEARIIGEGIDAARATKRVAAQARAKADEADTQLGKKLVAANTRRESVRNSLYAAGAVAASALISLAGRYLVGMTGQYLMPLTTNCTLSDRYCFPGNSTI